MRDSTPGGTQGIADLRPLARAKEQKAWYWYDWANSAYVTTIGTVMFGPYFIGLAENAAGADDRVGFLGMDMAPGSVFNCSRISQTMSMARPSEPASSASVFLSLGSSSTKYPAPRRGSMRPRDTSSSNAATTVFFAYPWRCASSRKEGNFSPVLNAPSRTCRS